MKPHFETAPLSDPHRRRARLIPSPINKLRSREFGRPAVILAFLLSSLQVTCAAERNPSATAPATSTNAALPSDPLQMLFRRALVEEESSRNLSEAIQDYQQLLAHFDARRELHATVLFRLGECYRKQGLTNEAIAHYQRILREFTDQQTLLTLSQQNLAELGQGAPSATVAGQSGADRETQRRLLQQALELAEAQVTTYQRRFQGGVMPADQLVPPQREVLRLRREIAALEPGSDADAEIRRLLEEEKKLVEELVENRRRAVGAGAASQEDLWVAQRQLLDVERQIAAIGANLPAASASQTSALPSPLPDEEREIARLRALMRNSPDLVNAPGEKGETPLAAAASRGQLAVVRFLLENGAEVQAKALLNAAANGHRAVVELLIQNGAEVDAREPDTQRTALHAAAERGFRAVSEVLLEHKASIDAQDVEGRTPLHLASASGHLAVMDALLSRGANVNAADRTEGTPLAYAVAHHQLAATRRLIEKKADLEVVATHRPLDSRNVIYQGVLPLHIAVANGDVAMVEMLLKAGANPDGRSLREDNSPGITPLVTAVIHGRKDLTRLLLDYGARADAPGAEPVIGEAIEKEKGANVELVERLIEAGANVNGAFKGTAPLHLAVRFNRPELIELLAERGANLNAVNDVDGWTALHFAAYLVRPELVELLLKKGADPNVRTLNGETPLEMIRNRASSEDRQKVQTVVSLLLAHGALEYLPRLDRIEVSRSSRDYRGTVFHRPESEQSERTYTLFELLAVQYGLLARPLSNRSIESEARVNYPRPNFSIRTASALPFPDFARMVIHRATADGKGWQKIPVNLTEAFQSRECLNDIELQWGDMIEVPELDHPINEEWKGLSDDALATLQKCLTRRVTIVVKGTENTVILKPDILMDERTGQVEMITSNKSFLLLAVLRESKLLLASSDLSRVRVTRTNPVTGRKEVWILDCSTTSKPGIPRLAPLRRFLPDQGDTTADQAQNMRRIESDPRELGESFWLRDGDYIEVPEKSG